MIFDGFSKQLPDIDPEETAEWVDSFDAVLESQGKTRAQFLLLKLLERAREQQVGLPAQVSTPYINTIPPEQEPWFPGDEHIERRIRAFIRWNAAVMVSRANNRAPGIGGHLATFASSASLYEVGFQPHPRGHPPRRGLGQTSLSRVPFHADAIGVPVWEAAEDPESVPGLGTAARKALARFMSTMVRLRERADSGASVGELLDEMLHETGYLEALQAERTIEAQGRMENLEELVQVAREYDANAEQGSVGEFLQQISLLSDADSIRDDEGLVTLMTLHNAKGLEFPIVFIIGMEDGVFPHSRALDEGGGGAPALLRRHHARHARPHAHLRAPPQLVRDELRRPALALHRRDPARADRPGRPPVRSAPAGRRAASPRGRTPRRRPRPHRRHGRGATAPARSSTSATTSSTPPSARAW